MSIVNGATNISIDADDQKRSGIASTALVAASSVSMAPAYAMVVDLTRLSDLGNAAAAGQAQLAAATARTSASRAAFERTRALHADDPNAAIAHKV